jgi:YidC/Oxa1 family membrane protein insertase
MNKQDRIIVAVLFAALIAWLVFQPRSTTPSPPPQQPAQTNANSTAAAVLSPPVISAPTSEVVRTVEPPPSQPESRMALANDELHVTVSSWGASVRNVSLLQFKALQNQPDPVRFDFEGRPALSFAQTPGIGTNASFSLARGPDGSVVMEAATTSGVTVTRTIALMPGYRLRVTDTFTNTTDRPLAVQGYGLRMGTMTNPPSQTSMAGIPDLGLDTLSTNDKASAVHWGSELPTFFGLKASFFGCGGPNAAGAPQAGTRRTDTPLAWAAVKDKFFVQILAPDQGCLYADLDATRESEATFRVRDVSATLWFAGQELPPGQAATRSSTYYVGPKKYLLLRTFPNRQADVMEFGFWHWLCKPLLFVLIGLYAVVPNYGIAIILLTGLVRLVFWPLTHKSTESMKKMQELAPLMNELRERYKSDPQKMQQETMMLYRAHGVNPLSGCLPMLVQIPVFFALYVVLRSAVELRYADFLWIRDLSEPEGLFAGHIPILGSLNILPFLMTATMVWQQKLTPSTADDMQQKIMLGFSIAMMFMFYSLPSALLLYWTVSQGLSIMQLYMQHKAAEKKAAAKAAAK